MKPEELRIGNLVDYEKTTHMVKAVDCNNMVLSVWMGGHKSKGKKGWQYVEILEEYNDHIKNYEPIPLTSEWLEKLGFSNNTFNWSLGEFRVSKTNSKYNLGYGGVMLLRGTLESIHQLQNIYFAIKGQELTLKTKTNYERDKISRKATGRW